MSEPMNALSAAQQEVTRLRAVVTKGAELAYLAEAMIDQEDLTGSAGWDCLQSHAGLMIDAAKEVLP